MLNGKTSRWYCIDKKTSKGVMHGNEFKEKKMIVLSGCCAV
jgi:hypothetical protein